MSAPDLDERAAARLILVVLRPPAVDSGVERELIEDLAATSPAEGVYFLAASDDVARRARELVGVIMRDGGSAVLGAAILR